MSNREVAVKLTEESLGREAAAGQLSTLPWSFRLAESSGVPLPLVSGAVFLASLFLFLVCLDLTGVASGLRIGERPFWSNPWGFAEFFFAGLCAWLPAFVILVRRSAKQNLDTLRATLDASDAVPEWLGPGSVKYYRVAGAIGVGTAFSVDAWFFSAGVSQELPEAARAFVVWATVRDVAVGWFTVRAWAVALSVALHFYRLGDRNLAVRLLDSRDLSPFVRQGFRLALLHFIGIAIASPLFGLLPIEQTQPFLAAAPLLAAPILVAALLLYLPCAGIHRAVVREKSAELERVREEIEEQCGMAFSADDASKTVAASRLPGLLAYEARVEKVREWPIDVFGVLRFLFYVAIPVGSWVASALVERLVTGVLD